MKVEGLDLIGLPSQDVERSVAFYEQTLGLKRLTHKPGKMVDFDIGGATLGISDPTQWGHKFVPVTAGTLMLRVPDVDASAAELRAKGIEVSEVLDTGVCKMAFFNDPDGNALILHRRYKPEED